MSQIIDKILTEWAYRVPDGMPNPKNPYHMVILEESLNELRLPRRFKEAFLQKIREKISKVYLKGKKAPTGAKVQTGPRGGEYYMGDTSTGQPQGGPALKKKPKSKSQKKADDHVAKYQIESKLKNAKTEQDEMDVVGDIIDAENQHILDGNYGPGGGAASYGEFNYSEATNGFLNGDITPLDEKPPKPVPKEEHIETFGKANHKNKRIAYAQELGIPYPDPEEEPWITMVIEELARRETWVDSQMEDHKDSKVKKDKFKSKKDEESQREWLRVGFDGGRSTVEDLVNDPDYGPMDPDKPSNSMIMSPANQKVARGLLKKKLKECGDLKNPQQRTDCEKHYNGQIENFNHGMEDHDTGTLYYDVDGNLRFINTSNKKSKSFKDPHNNATAESRIPEVLESMGEIADSGDYPGMNEKKVAGIINKAQEKATDISVGAAKNVMEGRDENGKQKYKITTTTKPADSGGLGVVAKTLPAKKAYQQEPAYFNKAAKHKKTQAKLEELYGQEPPKYTEEQQLVAIVEVAGENGAWDPHGKFINKMGQMYNKVNDRFNDLRKQGLSEEEAYIQISKESIQEGGKLKGKPLYSVDDLKKIRGNTNLQKAGKLNEGYKGAMAKAHNVVVQSAQDADEAYMRDNPGEVNQENEITGEPENGPHVRGYVKSWMKGMHWDKYIDNLDGKKNIQIGGVNCKPADFRKCLAKTANLPDEPKPEEGEKTPTKKQIAWRKQVQTHLEKNIKIDANSNAVNLRSKKGGEIKSLGEDTWRSAGDAKKIASGIGDDMISCIKKSVSARKNAQRAKK